MPTTAERRGSPLSRPTAGQTATVVVAAPLLAAGLIAGAVLLSPRSAAAAIGAGLLALMFLFAMVAVIVRRRLPRGVASPRITTIGSEPAVFFPRWTPSAVMGTFTLFLLGTAATCFAVAIPTDLWVLSAPLYALAAYFLVPVILTITRVWVVGGIWLTPTHVVNAQLSVRSEAPWEAIVEVRRAPGPAVIAPNAVNRRVLPWLARRLAPTGQLTLSFEDLAVSSTTVFNAISRFHDDPAARAELGTESSLLEIQRERASRGETSYIPGSDPVLRSVERRRDATGRVAVGIAVGVGIALAAVGKLLH